MTSRDELTYEEQTGWDLAMDEIARQVRAQYLTGVPPVEGDWLDYDSLTTDEKIAVAIRWAARRYGSTGRRTWRRRLTRAGYVIRQEP